MFLKKRRAFTFTETIIVMTIVLMIIGMIFFVIVFIFQTMYRINFNIETVAVFETVQSRLDSVFSMWYKDDDKQPVISDSSKSVTFTTMIMKENDKGWLTAVATNVRIKFAKETHAISIKVAGEAEKNIFTNDYIHDMEFGFDSQSNRALMATITFLSPNQRFSDIRFTKFLTIN